MAQAIQNTSKPAEKLYTIGTVSQLTGVGVITLRAWERRYELIEPIRKASGHRLYTHKHVEQINRITALTRQGMRLSQILPDMLEPDLSVDDLDTAEESVWSKYIDSMIDTIEQFDEERLDEIYNEALSLYPIDLMTKKLLRPLLIELGLRWEKSIGSISEEHFFAFYLRNKLGARFHHQSRRTTGPCILLAGLPNEHHEIAIILFGLAAHERGFRLLTLGANMPLGELAAVAKQKQCDAIVLSGAVEPAAKLLEEGLTELVEQVDIPVFVGGRTSMLAFNEIIATGADALGQDMNVGLERICKRLNW
jgi:DNA-binding transcriptional MerR regulator/methylmalonyl-CoA mutase cobalamin-binding subunit